MDLCRWARDSIRSLWQWLFPPERETPECLRVWLEQVFPGIDLDRVHFHEGFPPAIKPANPEAIALPGIHDAGSIHVYFRPGLFDPCTCDGLTLIGHEMTHVRQYMDHANGYGAGFVRGFMLVYLLCIVRHGYDNHPMENEAEAFEQDVRDCCTDSPCDCTGADPVLDPGAMATWEANCGTVVLTESAVGFWEHLRECVPGFDTWWRWANRVWAYCGRFFRERLGEAGRFRDPATTAPGTLEEEAERAAGRVIATWAQGVFVCLGTSILALLMWALGIIWLVVANLLNLIVVLAIGILWLAAEILSLVATAVWAIIAGILCLLGLIWDGLVWLWNRIRELLEDACDWATRLERRCANWEERRRRECQERERRERRECRERERRERRECHERERRERRECREREERRRRDCCDWIPCSWGCKAFSWIVEVVCVAWHTVVEWVCVAWHTVVEWVCVAWHTIVEWVCVAWTWVVTRVCRSFTWVVTGVSCWASS